MGRRGALGKGHELTLGPAEERVALQNDVLGITATTKALRVPNALTLVIMLPAARWVGVVEIIITAESVPLYDRF